MPVSRTVYIVSLSFFSQANLEVLKSVDSSIMRELIEDSAPSYEVVIQATDDTAKETEIQVSCDNHGLQSTGGSAEKSRTAERGITESPPGTAKEVEVPTDKRKSQTTCDQSQGTSRTSAKVDQATAGMTDEGPFQDTGDTYKSVPNQDPTVLPTLWQASHHPSLQVHA